MLHVEPATRSGAQAVLDHLVAEGVSIAFGYPGGAIMPLYDALFHERRIEHILTRHEAAAAFAAGAYGRTTGNVGVCIATSGPGATNLITGLLDAYMDSVPLVAITGQVRSPLMGTDGFQEADVAAIASSCVKRAFVVRSIDELVPCLHRAFKIARGPRPGPVLVDIPTDVLRTLMTPAVAELDFTWAPPQPPEEPQIDPAAVERAIAILRNARRPLVIVGGGARIAGAVDEFREFVYRAGVPHAATINGLGCANPGDPTFLGMLGMHGWKAANRAVMTADAIFALGMRFDDRVTGRTDRFATGARIVHADIDASEFNKIIPVELTLHGDLRATLRALNKAVARTNIPVFARWCDEAKSLGGALPRDRAKDGHLSATDVLDAFFATAPSDVVVATDVGQHQMWAAQRARPMNPRHFLTSAGLGSMGFGLPAAIGAQFAHPGKPVVAIVGDGGFQMSMAELATLRRHDLPVKVLLIDNRNLGMVRQWQQLFYDERYSATSLHDNPDFCAIARAYDVQAENVDSAAALPAALERFFAAEGPVLLHAACYPVENCWPMIPPGAAVDEMVEPVHA